MKFMRRALELAQKGIGYVSPNPMVGAVIVRNGNIISEGWHTAYGKPHAEIEALENLKSSNEIIKNEDIMYVTLEPCNHYGKTPPCTEAIVNAGIKNVVIAMLDPNPLVSGKGVKRLEESGVTVEFGTLEKEAEKLNRVFIKHMKTGMPYCATKWAMTLDGKMATDMGDSQWISGEGSRTLVHKWRSESDAVLIGSGTAIKDNPMLNVRMVEGENPYRVVVDSQGKLPLNSKLVKCNDPEKTVIATTAKAEFSWIKELRTLGIEVVILPEKETHVDLVELFKYLAKRGIVSIFSECGPIMQGALMREGLIDHIAAFISPQIVGGQVNSPFASLNNSLMEDAVKLDSVRFETVGDDILVEANVRRSTCLQG